MGALPMAHRFSDNRNVLIVHASLRNDRDDIDDETSQEQLESMFPSVHERLIVRAHSRCRLYAPILTGMSVHARRRGYDLLILADRPAAAPRRLGATRRCEGIVAARCKEVAQRRFHRGIILMVPVNPQN